MERYEIRIAGQISPRRAVALACELERAASTESVLLFAAVDQAALYGLITRLRDAGLELVAVERTAALNRQEAGPPAEGRPEVGGTGHV